MMDTIERLAANGDVSHMPQCSDFRTIVAADRGVLYGDICHSFEFNNADPSNRRNPPDPMALCGQV